MKSTCNWRKKFPNTNVLRYIFWLMLEDAGYIMFTSSEQEVFWRAIKRKPFNLTCKVVHSELDKVAPHEPGLVHSVYIVFGGWEHG